MTVHDWTTLKVGLGLDVSGAIVDVSDYLLGSVTRSWGRQSQFDRPRAGRVSFTLDNSDGRFSLDNTSVYASPLREGRAGVFELNGRLVAFRVDSLTPEFADVANVETARVRVSGVDMLGQADAKKIANPLWAMADGQGVTSHFPFSDLAGSTVVANRVEGEPSLIPSGDVSLTFGVAGHSSWSGDQCTVDVAAAGSGSLTGNTGFFGNALIGIETNVYGSVWITPENQTSTAEFFWRLIVAPPTTGYSLTWRLLNSSIQLYNVSTASWDTAATVTEGVAYNVTVGIESGDVVMYVNGELAASYSDFGTSGALGAAGVSFGGAGETSVTLSDLIFTPTRLQVEGLGITTEAERLNALAQMSTTVTFDTLPTGLSNAPISAWQSSGSMLDAILDVLNIEQGYISCETSGTFDNPVEKIVIRERDRPTAISQTFALTADVLGQPDLKRSISNTLSAVNVTSLTGGTIRVQDATLQELVGDADRTERVELATQNQMLAWGQDRLIRGNPDGIELTSFTVDARTADTDRWADLLGLVAGDRIQVTEFPETQLGFTTRDGWIIGCDESHTRDERSTFKWHLQPTIAGLGKYDTAKYAADGDLTLSSGINAAVTSMSVATSSVKFTTTDLPQTIVVDDEQMTVTAVTSATPQVFTVTRGANGTTAASHSSGAAVEIMPTFVYGF